MEYPEGEAEPFIDSCFIEKFKTGDFHKGPHLMGFTNLETAESLSCMYSTCLCKFLKAEIFLQFQTLKKSGTL